MRTMWRVGAAFVLTGSIAFAAHALAQTPPGQAKTPPGQAKNAMAAGQHALANTADLKWGPAPPGLPAGGQIAVVDGDPGKPGHFIMAAKLPNGYKVPPHWHPTDENIVVTSGSLLLGVGDKWDDKSMHALNPGGAARMPAKVNHTAMAKGETVFYIIGMGPFEITYVNPSDDPRKATTK